MHYAQSMDFRGDPATAFTAAVATLGACGFRLESKSSHSLEFTSPGRCHHPHEAPLLGASHVTIRAGAGRIEVSAEVGGGRCFRQPLVAVLVAGVAAVVAGVAIALRAPLQTLDWRKLLPVVAVPIFPLIMVPWLLRARRQRTVCALDTLLNNIVVAGRNP